ncbi:MAG: polyprenyl synthetase family protein [Sporichthyaceae bacterium]
MDEYLRALRAAVGRLDPITAEQAAYHFGWSDGDGAGKAVRPRLALLGARAVGAEAGVAVPGAVAVELVHNYSLLHDDLIDGDLERRHRPTVWRTWGTAGAVLSGDALVSLAMDVLLEVPGAAGAAAARLLSAANTELIRGQVQDVSFERHPEVPVEQVLAMAEAKTGALLSAAAAIGAVLAGAGDGHVGALREYGRHLGLAFQLADDVLGVWGDPERTGKPAQNDLRARKTSLPVAWTIGQGGAAADRLIDWSRSEREPSELELAELAELAEKAGGRAWARGEALRHADAARAELEGLPGDRAALAELRELAAYVADRDH